MIQDILIDQLQKGEGWFCLCLCLCLCQLFISKLCLCYCSAVLFTPFKTFFFFKKTHCCVVPKVMLSTKPVLRGTYGNFVSYKSHYAFKRILNHNILCFTLLKFNHIVSVHGQVLMVQPSWRVLTKKCLWTSIKDLDALSLRPKIWFLLINHFEKYIFFLNPACSHCIFLFQIVSLPGLVFFFCILLSAVTPFIWAIKSNNSNMLSILFTLLIFGG